MKWTELPGGISGGAFLGAVSLKRPQVFGYTWQPPPRAELAAGICGCGLGLLLIIRDRRRKKKGSEPLKLGR